MTVIEGPEAEFDGANASGSARSPTTRVLTDAWRKVAQVQRDALRSLTFGELVRRMKRHADNMYYI